MSELDRRLAALAEVPPGDLSEWDQWLEASNARRSTWSVSPDQRPDPPRTSGEPADVGGPSGDTGTSVADELATAAPWIGAVRACDSLPETFWTAEPAGKAGVRSARAPGADEPGRGRRPDRQLIATLAALERSRREPGSGRAAGTQPRPCADPRPAELLNRLRRLVERAEALAADDGLPAALPDRSQPVRHRLQPGAGPARQCLLRPAGLGIVPDQLPGRRAGRGPAPPLVPARPPVHPRRRAGSA